MTPICIDLCPHHTNEQYHEYHEYHEHKQLSGHFELSD
jgi:hypothetical protein